MPVTEPTLAAGERCATRANVAPDAAPRAPAMDRNTIVPRGVRAGVVDWINAPTAITAKATVRTDAAWTRSESQPPTGRIKTATTTKPAIRFDASTGVRP